MAIDSAPRLNPIFGGKKSNNILASHAVTLKYQSAARELDKYLGHPGYANWFHYATWGTFNVGQFIRMEPDGPMGDALVKGEQLIFDSAMEGLAQFVLGGPVQTEEPEVNKAFEHYAEGRWLRATITLMRHEQAIVQEYLEKAFAALLPFSPEVLTKYMVINFPHRVLSVVEDVPNFPHTAVTNWLDYDQRARWMAAQEAADLDCEAIIKGSPYA